MKTSTRSKLGTSLGFRIRALLPAAALSLFIIFFVNAPTAGRARVATRGHGAGGGAASRRAASLPVALVPPPKADGPAERARALLVHDDMAIPNIVHFVFGMEENFGHMGFSLMHYIALLGAALNVRAPIFWHHRFLPPADNVYWSCAASLVTPVEVADVTEVHGKFFPTLHVAHKADVIRLNVLRSTGGIYLDSDVIALRSFDELRRLGGAERFVMGREEVPGQSGLCNAVLIGAPNSSFVNRWWARYDSFDPQIKPGDGKSWAYHSVILPRELAGASPHDIAIVGPSAFFSPGWDKLKELYEEDDGYNYRDNFAVHLWTSAENKRYGGLAKLTVEGVFAGKGSFHRVARKVLTEAADAGLLCDYIAKQVAAVVPATPHAPGT